MSQSQSIYGYVAASLADIGSLDEPLRAGAQNTPFHKFQDINKTIEQKVSSVRLQDRLWKSCIATKDSKPVIVLGIVHDRGAALPLLPDNLTKIFSNQRPEDLPLKYDSD